MTAPTKEEVQEFMNKNKSFFATPLTDEGQKEFQKFYNDANAIDKIADYSKKLIDLLYKNTQQVNEQTITPVVYAWRKGDFAPALEHEEVRQFIMDNKEHPALVMWANNKPAVELRETQTKTQPPSGTQDSSLSDAAAIQTLAGLKAKFIKMDKERFDYVFAVDDTSVMSKNVLMGRRLTREGVSGELFKSQAAFSNWLSEIISARDKPDQTQVQTQTETQTKSQNKELSIPPPVKANGLIDEFIDAIKNLCSAIVNFVSSLICKNDNDEAPKP
jgi:hypothetical protein